MRHATILVFVLSLAPLPAQTATRMTPELLWKLGRVSGGSLSPDGAWALYTVRRYDLAENKGDSDLWLVPTASGRSRQITRGKGSESDAQWVATPRGVRVFCTAKREEQEQPQVWSLDPKAGTWSQVTRIEGGVSNLKVSPSGRHLAFTREVKLDPTVNELYSDLPKADARIIDDLMYRHWDAWHDFKYSHLHVAPLTDDGTIGPLVDLMAGMKVDCPVPPFGGSEQFNWSADGRQIAYTAKAVERWAESTDSDIYVADLDGDTTKPRQLTMGMPGYDQEPVYSPDGRYLAWHSMARPGFESDRNRIMVRDQKTLAIWDLTEGLDQTAHDALWAPDSQGIYFRSEKEGSDQIFQIQLEDRALRQVTSGQHNWSLRDVAKDGRTLLVARQNMIRPWELFTLPAQGGEARALTHVNDDVFADLAVPTVRQGWVKATDGKQIHNWVVYPPGFDRSKKYPMIAYLQGGPQGQIGQWFSYRWNFHLMAAQGYVVMATNRRGLPGFGRAWNDQISGDWGGQAMQDILSSTDAMRDEPYIDKDRVAAVGASFGGYSGYWMMGNAQDRYCTIIAHAGVFNLESMYGSTEELFFVNWDLGGPYWKDKTTQTAYDRFSPHRFVGNWKTPLLVIHGQKDFRVPATQGMEAFTAAQVQGIPSRFLYFPEEGHWVRGPQNGVLWHRVFFDWLGRYCKPQDN